MRLLVIANETCASRAVMAAIRQRVSVDGTGEVFVVAPALSHSRVSHWFSSDVRSAREEASARLEQSLGALAAGGIRADGDLGDADPLQALDDAIRIHQPTHVLIATHTPERSQWLERKLVERAKAMTDLPVEHVVADLEAEARVGQSAHPPELIAS